MPFGIYKYNKPQYGPINWRERWQTKYGLDHRAAANKLGSWFKNKKRPLWSRRTEGSYRYKPIKSLRRGKGYMYSGYVRKRKVWRKSNYK